MISYAANDIFVDFVVHKQVHYDWIVKSEHRLQVSSGINLNFIKIVNMKHPAQNPRTDSIVAKTTNIANITSVASVNPNT